MNTAEKIEAAGKKKDEGNALFKAGKIARASKRYEKVSSTISKMMIVLNDCSFGVKVLSRDLFLEPSLYSLEHFPHFPRIISTKHNRIKVEKK